MKTYEVTGAGFDASTDATDDRVLWVKAASPEVVQQAIADTGASFCGEVNAGAEFDFMLPEQAAEILTVLRKFQPEVTEVTLGTRFQMLGAMIDSDENGVERITPAGSIAEVISIDDHPEQGVTYGFVVPSTGASGYLLEAELRDSSQNRVSSAGECEGAETETLRTRFPMPRG